MKKEQGVETGGFLLTPLNSSPFHPSQTKGYFALQTVVSVSFDQGRVLQHQKRTSHDVELRQG